MSSIHDETVALDTNVFIFALRRDPKYSACEILLFDKLSELKVYVVLQVLLELQRNLSEEDFNRWKNIAPA